MIAAPRPAFQCCVRGPLGGSLRLRNKRPFLSGLLFSGCPPTLKWGARGRACLFGWLCGMGVYFANTGTKIATLKHS